MVVGTLVMLWNIVVSLLYGQPAGKNPWGGYTLEWSTTSPPPENNFDTLPEIKSRRPVWDAERPDMADWKFFKTPEDSGRRPDRAKVCAWAFVISEAVFFVLLLVTYVVFNARHVGDGPTSATALDVPRTGVFTLFLLSSSLTFWLSERSLRAGRHTVFLQWLGVTILLGIIFLGGQAWEYAGLLTGDIDIHSDLFAATFFTVTGFHGLHVTGGLIALSIMFALGRKNYLTSAHAKPYGAVGVYWHFVDVVWIFVFAIIYLRVLQS
jgi:cytochrome c oxidase subunit 1/cytochrome c oxidase subunit I+III